MVYKLTNVYFNHKNKYDKNTSESKELDVKHL